MKRLALTAAAIGLSLLVAGCGGKGSSAEPPANFKVTAADASVIVTWTAEPDVEYWIFYGPGENITTANWATSGGTVVAKAVSPRTIGGLTNGKTYSFTINGRKDGGPGGPGAPTQVAVPRLSGIDWTVGQPLGTDDLRGIAGGNGLQGFGVAVVGANGALFSSVAQGPFTRPTNPAAPANLNGACFGGLGWVAVGAGGTLLFSNDTLTWLAQTTGTTSTLHGCASVGAAGFLVAGAAGTILTTTNGTNWAAATSGTTEHLYATTYGADRFVVVGANGTILTTPDGITVTSRSSGTTRALRGVAYAAILGADNTVSNVHVAVGDAGTLLTSTDTITWTVRPAITGEDLTGIVHGGQFVAVGRKGTVFTSPDGVSWTARAPGTAADLAAVARTQAGYVAVGAQGTNISSF